MKDLDVAVRDAQTAGAEVVVTSFPDPIGRDAVVRFPGGVLTQLYWHTKAPAYPAFERVPENRVYISTDAAEAFLKSFLRFSGGSITRDETHADGAEIGRPGYSFRRVEIASGFGRWTAFVTDGILPWPYGRETTGYGVEDLSTALRTATSLGASVAVVPSPENDRSAMVVFPGGYIAELHQALARAQ